ncbi:asparagine synthase-related protein [Sphingobium aromaticiconvertens]|uniref:asparagine synthase-related protein n=1 Tax=Sphingobium aromaticiconvertens TaxID=365341 RepID=UPI0030184061
MADDYDADHVDAVFAAARAALVGARTFEAYRLQVVSTGPAIIAPKEDADLLILGKIFAGLGERPVANLSPGANLAIAGSAGSWLTGQFWGQYVAFLSDPYRHRVHIIRDPTGAVPCYYVENNGTVYAASDVDILSRCGLLHREIDWVEIARTLIADQLRPASTALVGLRELLAGERMTVDRDGAAVDQIWSPWSFAARDKQILDEQEAVDAVRATALGCVRSLASSYEKILLSLSGGLDSSIVAACLKEAGANFECLTMATLEPAGDERHHAGVVANATGSRLHIAYEQADLVNLTACAGHYLPRPIARAFAQSGDHAHSVLADEHGLDAYFGGAGGDNVFCFLQSAAPVADRLLDGELAGAWSTAAHISELAEVNAIRVYAKAIERAWLRRRGYRWPLDTSFVNPSASADLGMAADHPWLHAPAAARPGKAGHIASIMKIQNHLEGFPRELVRPIISPLLAQPLMEVCLRIPSWMWCEGGRDRAIARRAFEGLLPRAILDRRQKGTPDGFIARLYDEKRLAIRDMLTDGALAEQGLIDLDAIVKTVSTAAPATGIAFFRIMALVDVEMWVQSQLD